MLLICLYAVRILKQKEWVSYMFKNKCQFLVNKPDQTSVENINTQNFNTSRPCAVIGCK